MFYFLYILIIKDFFKLVIFFVKFIWNNIYVFYFKISIYGLIVFCYRVVVFKEILGFVYGILLVNIYDMGGYLRFCIIVMNFFNVF